MSKFKGVEVMSTPFVLRDIKRNKEALNSEIPVKRAGERMFAGADKQLFDKARILRGKQTYAEELLWNYLRTKPLGFKFRRQHPFLIYILDFYCHALHLVIEVDGSIHDLEEIKQHDALRQQHLQDQGLTILRFTNEQIITLPEKVIEAIESYLNLNHSK